MITLHRRPKQNFFLSNGWGILYCLVGLRGFWLVYLENNLHRNFWTARDRYVIFGMPFQISPMLITSSLDLHWGPAKCGCPIAIGLSVRLGRKSLYNSTCECYIQQTCTKYSSWHDLLIPHGGLCPWPTFHAWVTTVRKKWLSLYYSTYWCYIHQTCTNCSSWHDLMPLVACILDLHFTLQWPRLGRNG